MSAAVSQLQSRHHRLHLRVVCDSPGQVIVLLRDIYEPALTPNLTHCFIRVVTDV